MATCWRCETVEPRNGDAVGVCMQCNALACRLDGERDDANLDFYCGMCQSHRLTLSAGLHGGPADPNVPAGPGEGGGGDGGTRPFVSSQDFERRFPTIAEQTAEHRRLFREQIDDLLIAFEERGRGVAARALQTVRTSEWDPEGVAETTRLLADQIVAARDRGAFDAELFADALGVAAWSVGVPAGEEAHAAQLRKIGDARLQVAVGIARVVV